MNNGEKTEFMVVNTGLFQVRDVLVSFNVNSTANVLENDCPEGEAIPSKEPSELFKIKAKTMTPEYDCIYYFDGALDISNVSITSEGRMTVWYGSGIKFHLIPMLLLLAVVFVSYGAAILYISSPAWTPVLNFLRSKTSLRKFSPLELDSDIRKIVKEHYNIRIDDKDSAVIESIFFNKSISRQIAVHTKLPLSLIKRIIGKLHKYELVGFDPLHLEKGLKESLDKRIEEKRIQENSRSKCAV